MQVNKIELPKELTEETALEFIGNIAGVCTSKFNKSSKEQCIKRAKRNLTESLGNPTRAFEFIPTDSSFYGYYNMRACIEHVTPRAKQIGKESEIMKSVLSFCINRSDFHVFHLRIPKFIISHLKTHTTLSSLTESVRLGNPNKEVEYFFPPTEINPNVLVGNDRIDLSTIDECKMINENNGNDFWNDYTGSQFMFTMQKFYKRKEIWNRPLSDFVMSDMLICGYSNSWQHFINVRTDKATQKETRMIAEMIKEQL